ncbi:MAG: Na/Pi symporter [Desulfobacteraceae bacterium]
MIVTKLGVLLGGLGLFLLGMHLMTEGLKTAAGTALRSVLEKGTQTPMRGILSGALITAIVQSSSAVTVAIIGFVNAGLMTLRQAIGVIYGSNVGTTITGWLVALVGFKFDYRGHGTPDPAFIHASPRGSQKDVWIGGGSGPHAGPVPYGVQHPRGGGHVALDAPSGALSERTVSFV